jgi:arylsulfatase A-like enzyme
LLIITDDQGHGDLSLHGNPVLRTPNLDRIAQEGARLVNFYVSPVCSPTRSSLMTGRWNYRTGVVDTFIGRSMMHPDEVTLAEALGAAGYRTGIFGKWHLGDNYPLRAIDQGFQEALVLKGGGIGQPSDPPGGESYFDTILQHNGRPEKQSGYVTDVITDAALRFVRDNRERPFLAYVAYNCPHTPLEVKEADYLAFKDQDLSHERFPQVGHKLPGQPLNEITAKVYGMVADIDRNVGRLLARLDEDGLTRDTIVVFLTDNGPQQVRYNSGMLDRKGDVHEGGIRVPCFVRWPGHVPAGRAIDRIAAHIDLMPTLLDACGVARPAGVKLDGVSLLRLLIGDVNDWPDRTLYFQWHRGDVPELGRAFAARSQGWKLVRPEGKKDLELYDMKEDPLEFHDLAAWRPEQARLMYDAYARWFEDVRRERNFEPPRIILGDPREPASMLTRQDWRGERASWGKDGLGHWEVRVAREGRYKVTLHFEAPEGPTKAHLALAGKHAEAAIEAGAMRREFEVTWPTGPARLEAWLDRPGGKSVGVRFVEVAWSE